MVTKLTEFLASDGSKVYIQYDDEVEGKLRATSATDDLQKRTEQFRQGLKEIVRQQSEVLLEAVQDGVKGLAKPSKIVLEFGVQAGGEAGIPFVTKGTAQANVKITIEWQEVSPVINSHETLKSTNP